MKKIYYYHFNTFDTTFWATMIALVMAIGCCCTLYAWGLFVITSFLWCYKHINHKALTITDKNIKIDLCEPLAWKDIKKAETKTIRMGCKDYKILSLTPKDKIKYHYNLLQKHSCFGPFAIPLYGILTPADEKEITKLVTGKVK